MNDLEEELASARVEDKDGAVDGLGRQVALERLVDRHTVYVRVVYEPGYERVEWVIHKLHERILSVF